MQKKFIPDHIGMLSDCYCENSGASQYTIPKAVNECRVYTEKK